MLEVKAFKSVNDLIGELDNGGRFYHLFSHADDKIVTKGELAKAAGQLVGANNAFLFLKLATLGFSEAEKFAILNMLEPNLRERYRESMPKVINPSSVDHEGKAGDAVVVEGPVEHCHDKTQFGGFIMIPITVGEITTYTMTPIFDNYAVYRVFDEENRDSKERCAVIAVPLNIEFADGDRVRFAGYLRDLEFNEGEVRTNSYYLEATYYSRVGKGPSPTT
ncbi:hypothetical protein Enr13x_52100 [Stieleria neptunia]|uniref:Uncharacterized protein n=2 Tax=Stieleria neptunia TaxID=2527979 RepID=A0A518HX41_9BACT|nr:hypothetical protein Enr13x_52100 [Stieleria neptunia]